MSKDNDKMQFEETIDKVKHLYESNRFREVEKTCRNILGRIPEDHEALYFLSAATFKKKQYVKALESIDRAISSRPNLAKLHNLRGVVLRQCGDLLGSEASFLKAIELDNRMATAYDNLGLVLRQQDRVTASIEMHREAVRLSEKCGVFRLHLAQALEKSGHLDGAQGQFRVAAFLDPSLAEAYNGLGRLLSARGNLPGAVECFRQAIHIDKALATGHLNLGNALRRLGDPGNAATQLRTAIRLGVDPVKGYQSLGMTLRTARRCNAALRAFRKVAQLAPQRSTACLDLADTLQDMGRVRPALRAYRAALELDPYNTNARSNMLFLLTANAFLPGKKMERELQNWERYACVPKARRFREYGSRPSRRRKLRIGYVSPDFRVHVARQFFEAVLAYHDRSRFEVFCYAEVARPDHATRQAQQFADSWFTTVGVTDQELARRIHEDGIDILVDLAGHTAKNRLAMFCYKSAPVQATYLGYFGSTGVSAIDYWITDWILHPEDTREPVVENIYRLPRCAFGYGIPAHSPALDFTRRSDGPVTFGYLNNLVKATRASVDCWGRILRACPGAKLVMRDDRFVEAETRRQWRRRFATRGVDPERVDFQPKARHDQYLHSLQDIDIALDPFPRTGGTTTADCLWMGVPVVSLAGERYVERLSATKLSAVGLPELVAGTPDEYVDNAIRLAQDAHWRLRIKSSLRERMKHSPLCNTRDLTRSLEAAFTEMWRRYLGKR